MPRSGATFDEVPSWKGQATAVALRLSALGWVMRSRESPPRLPTRPLSLRQPPLPWRGFSEGGSL